jgi:hypothetical protein
LSTIHPSADSYLQPSAEEKEGLFRADAVLDDGWYRFKVSCRSQSQKRHNDLDQYSCV